MRQINLLPYREKSENRLISLHLMSVAASLFLIISICILIDTLETSTTNDMRHQLSEISNQNSSIKKRIGKVKDLDSLKISVQKKLALVDKLQSGRFLVFIWLAEISDITPDTVWIDSLQEHDNGWIIEGHGFSNNVIADFARFIERSDLFDSVSLNNVNKVTYNGKPARSFTISMKNIVLIGRGS